jgi:ATP-dependent helicase/nuclease subunit A
MRDHEQGEEQLLTDEAGNAVTLTTIHSAKGLEWPVVILIEPFALEGKVKARVLPAAGTLELKLHDDLSSEAFEKTWEEEKRQSEEEARRLFYVACTRAMDHLIVAMAFGERGASLLDHVQGPSDPAASDFATRQSTTPWLKGVRLLDAGGLPLAKPAEEVAAEAPRTTDPWPAWTKKSAAGYVPWAVHEPTAMAALLGEAAEDLVRDVKDAGRRLVKPEEVERWRQVLGEAPEDSSGARVGTVVHRVLERIAFLPRAEGGYTPSPSWDDALRLAAAEAGLDAPEIGRAKELLGRLLDATEFRSLLGSAKRLLRETPFLLPDPSDPKRMIPGRLDLLLELADGWLILDYKTGRPDPEGWLEQLCLYRTALSRRFPDRPWRACVLHTAGAKTSLLEVVH